MGCGMGRGNKREREREEENPCLFFYYKAFNVVLRLKRKITVGSNSGERSTETCLLFHATTQTHTHTNRWEKFPGHSKATNSYHRDKSIKSPSSAIFINCVLLFAVSLRSLLLRLAAEPKHLRRFAFCPKTNQALPCMPMRAPGICRRVSSIMIALRGGHWC